MDNCQKHKSERYWLKKRTPQYKHRFLLQNHPKTAFILRGPLLYLIFLFEGRKARNHAQFDRRTRQNEAIEWGENQ
jgi:hypothetical protein